MKSSGWIGMMLLPMLCFCMLSCDNYAVRAFGFADKDSVSMNAADQAQQELKPLLMDRWDSLHRNQLNFTIDSLNPVDIKTQKRMLRDSLRRELNKRPKHVYLTFDDGPLVGSGALDSIARKKQIKINAFLVGRHADFGKARQRDLERFLNNPLVACYNHSYTHGFNKFAKFYSNAETAYMDFVKNQDKLGIQDKIARLPGRNIWMYNDYRKIDLQNGASTAQMLFDNGYKIYGWDVEWRIQSVTGNPVQSLESVYHRMRNMLNNKSTVVPNNIVLLMHDDMFQTKKGARLLSNLIDSLKKENYQFEFMTDYPKRY